MLPSSKKKNVVALLGPRGSFSDSPKIGAWINRKLRGKFAKVYKKKFGEIFDSVKKGAIGLVPLKNKLIGQIEEVIKGLKGGKYEELGVLDLKIQMVLAVKKGTKKADIKKIYVSEIVFGQCEKYLKKHFPYANIYKNFRSSSEAYTKVVQQMGVGAKISAAVGSTNAAKIYKLKVIARNIQGSPKDFTRFVLIRKKRKSS